MVAPTFILPTKPVEKAVDAFWEELYRQCKRLNQPIPAGWAGLPQAEKDLFRERMEAAIKAFLRAWT